MSCAVSYNKGVIDVIPVFNKFDLLSDLADEDEAFCGRCSPALSLELTDEKQCLSGRTSPDPSVDSGYSSDELLSDESEEKLDQDLVSEIDLRPLEVLETIQEEEVQEEEQQSVSDLENTVETSDAKLDSPKQSFPAVCTPMQTVYKSLNCRRKEYLEQYSGAFYSQPTFLDAPARPPHTGPFHYLPWLIIHPDPATIPLPPF